MINGIVYFVIGLGRLYLGIENRSMIILNNENDLGLHFQTMGNAQLHGTWQDYAPNSKLQVRVVVQATSTVVPIVYFLNQQELVGVLGLEIYLWVQSGISISDI